jgi:hypothetical protein
MTRWHASTELRHTTDAVVAKTVGLAAGYTGRLESGLGLALSAARSAERDTSG